MNKLTIPLIAHISHSSTRVPKDVRASLRLGDAELQREILCLTDWYVDQLFASVRELGGVEVLHPVSRLVVDPERFDDDEKEIMASKGMGAIYTRTSDGRGLRAVPSEQERRALLNRFYRPHHEAAETAVEACLQTFGKCLLLDCHSFPSRPIPCDLDQDPIRPNVCLGTDPFHTPPALTEAIEQGFRDLGWAVYRDKPYKGTYVPLKFYGKDKRVASIMIELNRKLYMDEETGEKLLSFPAIQRIVAELVSQVMRLLFSS